MKKNKENWRTNEEKVKKKVKEKKDEGEEEGRRGWEMNGRKWMEWMRDWRGKAPSMTWPTPTCLCVYEPCSLSIQGRQARLVWRAKDRVSFRHEEELEDEEEKNEKMKEKEEDEKKKILDVK